MTISQTELNAMMGRINTRLAAHKAKFALSVHFSLDRVNDLRNTPPIALAELESIFSKLIDRYLLDVLVLNDRDTFCIQCSKSNINIPCSIEKTSLAHATTTQKCIAITIMRKRNFIAKDNIIFRL